MVNYSWLTLILLFTLVGDLIEFMMTRKSFNKPFLCNFQFSIKFSIYPQCVHYHSFIDVNNNNKTEQNRQNNNPLKGKHFWGLRKIVQKANNRNISKFWNQFFSGTKLFFAGKDTLMTRISPHFHQTAESSKAEIC